MTERKSVSDISKSTSSERRQEQNSAGESLSPVSKADENTKPGQNAAANADDPEILQKGVGDGS